MTELDELEIDNIPAEDTNNDVNFEPFGKEITVDEVSRIKYEFQGAAERYL